MSTVSVNLKTEMSLIKDLAEVYCFPEAVMNN